MFIAEVPELPVGMTHGQSYQQASSNAEEAMRGWLQGIGGTGPRGAGAEAACPRELSSTFWSL